ncbi:MAG TPA: hypothetical protein VJH55_04325 [Candidatus Paceibacterota bacterium]
MSTAKKKTKKVKVPTVVGGDFSELRNAKIVFEHAINSVNKFYELFQKNRKGAKGSTTHVEQDLLRAMLIFSCSGLDAVVKQLIKDALVGVVNKEIGAQQEFQKFIERRMKRGNLEDKDKSFLDISWVAAIFSSSEPRKYLTDALQKNLTDDSLQSRDQLLKVAAHFAITQGDILKDADDTKKAFDVRNEIIHEMDVDLIGSKQGQKKRRVRSASDMVKQSENILAIGATFINIVHKKLYGTS